MMIKRLGGVLGRSWLLVWRMARRAARLVMTGSAAWRGTGAVMVLTALLLALAQGYDAFARYAWWSFALYALALTGGALLLAAGALLLLHLLTRFPPVFMWGLAAAALLALAAFANGGQRVWVVVVPFVLITAAWLGAAVMSWKRYTWRQATAVQRLFILSGLLVGGGGLVGGGLWLLWPGSDLTMPPNAALQAWTAADAAAVTLPDPAQPGPYAVRTLTYGSGEDQHRPEFGADVDLVTTPVDGASFLSGWTELRTAYWGFDETALPRNGRVWYPDAPGPFPLALVVHGNHNMEEFSDPGYGYLGELLASRGFIVASIDQNFLNGSSTADWLGSSGLAEENDARGWLLLEHLQLWRGWQETAANPFFHKVDLTQIALIGHSRGGEAVAVAAAFNHLTHYPDNAAVRFQYGFDIRAIVAIAPIDGQYKPADAGLPLQDVHYLTLHGTHDMDVTSFAGQQQFDRVQFSEEDWFKTAVYVYGANHGQFNTVWGDTDRGAPGIHLYNLEQLLPEADQQRIAQVFIAAFLEATLHENDAYVHFFRDYRIGVDWLPETIYLTRYEDGQMQFVATFEEDIDVTTTTLPGGRLEGRYLTTWREEDVTQKGRDLETRAVLLGWRERTDGRAPAYTITLPPTLTLSVTQTLVFSLADAGPVDEAVEDELRQPIDLHVGVEDAAGETAVLPLSHFAYLQPQLPAQLLKLSFMQATPMSEVVWQSFAFPLADFTAVNPRLDVTGLTAVRLQFDRTPAGRVVLDNLGFR